MSHRILLIEDDEDLLNLYRIGLEKEGFVVYTSSNGMQGITKAIEKDVDLILLDLMMPLAGGSDVLSMIQLNPDAKKIPIIIISNLNPGTVDISEYDDQVITQASLMISINRATAVSTSSSEIYSTVQP